MSSDNSPNEASVLPSWKEEGLRYYTLRSYFRQAFGGKIWKVSVDGGFSCPNIDDTVGTQGCIFCNATAFSPGRRLQIPNIATQIDEGLKRISRRYNADRLIAYFQPSTNTHAPVEQLRTLYEEALAHPNVVGLTIGTRPDAVPDDVLDLLAELSEKHWVQIELGLQTIHDTSLDWLRRGHDAASFFDAAARCRERGLKLGVHLILGLPGEGVDEIRATAEALAPLGLHSVKLHNLYVVRDTDMARLWEAGELPLPDLSTYASYVVDFLERTPATCVVDRISGDVPPPYFIGPEWAAKKHAIRAAIENEFLSRDSRQGSLMASSSLR
jgi:uncharacterized protein